MPGRFARREKKKEMPLCSENLSLPDATTQESEMKFYEKTKFTLLELLIVIAVIAILASLLIPGLNAARNKAKGVQCASNLRQAGFALMQYLQDFETSPWDADATSPLWLKHAVYRKKIMGSYFPLPEVNAENFTKGNAAKCPLYRFEGQTQCESTYGIMTSDYKSPGNGETYSKEMIGGLYYKAGSGSIEGALAPLKQSKPDSLILCCVSGQGTATTLSKALKRLDLPYLNRSILQHSPFEFYPGLRLDCAVLQYRWSQTFHENLTVSQ